MSKLTDGQIDDLLSEWLYVAPGRTYEEHRPFARAIEAAATAPLLQRIAKLEANEKVLLAQVQGHTKWREKIIKASEQAYGESAIRYKFSLTKTGKCMNTFPKEIDGRWFALVPAEDDGHIGHIARIAELEHQLHEQAVSLEEARKDAERYRWLRDLDEDPVLSLAAQYTDMNGSATSISQRIDAAIDAAMQKGQS